MPSRPVLIGRGLVTHTHPQEPASTTQNLNQQTHPTTNKHAANSKHAANQGQQGVTQHHNGSQRYGGHSGRETPGPIPNPEVKPASANGTAPDRMWESRTPPNIFSDGGHLRMVPIAIVWTGFTSVPQFYEE